MRLQWWNNVRRNLTASFRLAMSHKYTCELIPEDERHDPVPLPHQEAVILGRGPLTLIKGTKCARNQLKFYADCDIPKVTVEQIGANSSSVCDIPLKKGQVSEISSGDRVHFLKGIYPYVLDIQPNPKTSKTTLPESSKANHELIPKTIGSAVTGTKRKMYTAAIDAPVLITSKVAKLEDSPVDLNVPGWTDVIQGKLLVYCSPGLKSSAKIAAYDMDSTLITTQSGKVFPTDTNDWKILLSEVPGTLKALHKDGYKIVIITNQAGIAKGKVKVQDFRRKVENVVKKLGVPAQALVSTGNSFYRKPAPGMWNFLSEHANEGIPIDPADSFFVGDAAGRAANWAPRKKKDHSSADRLFALNLGVRFLTPEEHFLKQKPVPHVPPEFDPKSVKKGPLLDPPTSKLCSEQQELIVMVGPPGAGKSHFVIKHLVDQGYVYANRDTLKTWQQCVAVIDQALSRGVSAVVDNTNPDKASRARFVSVAKKRGVACRCFVMAVSQKHAAHNNQFRQFTDVTHEPVSDMVFNMYKSKFEEPSLDEGFAEILRVNFVPQFGSIEQENLYKMYLLDK